LRYRHATRGCVHMKYHDGSEMLLGDIVRTPIGKEVTTRGRVVMVGDTLDHLDIDQQFLSWVKTSQKLGRNNVVIEFMDKNPFEHEDPKFAPVGDYMFTRVDESLIFEWRP
jgi:hypothetical protein